MMSFRHRGSRLAKRARCAPGRHSASRGRTALRDTQAQASAHCSHGGQKAPHGHALYLNERGLPLRGYIPYLHLCKAVCNRGGGAGVCRSRAQAPGRPFGHPVGDALRPAGRWPEAGCACCMIPNSNESHTTGDFTHATPRANGLVSVGLQGRRQNHSPLQDGAGSTAPAVGSQDEEVVP